MMIGTNDRTGFHEGPILDDGVLDGELRPVELEDDGLAKMDGVYNDDGACARCPRRKIALLLSSTIVIAASVALVVALIQREYIQQSSSKQGERLSAPTPTPVAGVSNPTAYACANTVVGCSVSAKSTANWAEVGSIFGESAGDRAGRAIDISCDGSVVAVAASLNDGNGKGSGHVRVFQVLESNSWVQLGQDINGKNAFDGLGHSLSLSADGRRVAIGSRFNDDGGANAGQVLVLDYDDSKNFWTSVGDEILGESTGTFLGSAVSLSALGNRLAVGGYGNNATGAHAGHARVYELVDDTWTQIGSDIDGEAAGDRFGRAISLSGDGTVVAVGAHKNDGEAGASENAGHARVFQYDEISSEWLQLGDDINGDIPGFLLGSTVALAYSGDRVAVGAPGDGTGFLPGFTTVLDFNGTQWVPAGSTLRGGYSMDFSNDGERIVTGDPTSEKNAGHAIVYDYNGTDWIQVGEDISGYPDELSGSSVGISADGVRVLSAALVYDHNATIDIGLVRVYDMCQ